MTKLSSPSKRPPHAISLRTYFTLVFVVFSILTSFTISLAVGLRSVDQVKKGIGESLQQTAYELADKMDAFMWSRYSEVRMLTQFEALQHPEAPERIRNLLEQLQTTVPSFSWIGVLDPEGNVVASTQNILRGENIAQRPVFSEGIQGVFIGDVHDAVLLANLLPNPTGETMKFVDISMPLHDDSGTVTGVLATHLSWKWADEISARLQAPLYAQSGMEMMVLGAEDNLILLGKNASIGQSVSLPEGSLRDQTGWFTAPWEDGRTYVTGYAIEQGYQEFAGFGWKVIVRQPVETAYEGARRLTRDTTFIAISASLLFILIGRLLTRHLSVPIRNLAAYADTYQMGETGMLPVYRGIAEMEGLHRSIREMIRRLTESKAALDAMDVAVHRDNLTGILNRTGLKRYLLNVQEIVSLNGMVLAVMCLDLDGFKQVNDLHGHAAGDRVLVETATRLSLIIRSGEIAARLGGDEFIVVTFTRPDQPAHQMRILADRILHALHAPIPLPEGVVTVGCSLGTAFWKPGMDMDAVIQQADEALYISKRNGKGRATVVDNLPPDATS